MKVKIRLRYSFPARLYLIILRYGIKLVIKNCFDCKITNLIIYLGRHIESIVSHEQQLDFYDIENNGFSRSVSDNGRGGGDYELVDARSRPVAPRRFSSLSHTARRPETDSRARNKSLPNIFGQIDEESPEPPDIPHRSPSVAYLSRERYEYDNGRNSIYEIYLITFNENVIILRITT